MTYLFYQILFIFIYFIYYLLSKIVWLKMAANLLLDCLGNDYPGFKNHLKGWEKVIMEKGF